MADVRKLQEKTVRNWLLRGQLLAVKFDFTAAARAILEGLLGGCDGQTALVPGRQDFMDIELTDIDHWIPLALQMKPPFML